MNTKTKTNTKTSAMNEIRELTDDELNAVNGGAVNAYLKADSASPALRKAG